MSLLIIHVQVVNIITGNGDTVAGLCYRYIKEVVSNTYPTSIVTTPACHIPPLPQEANQYCVYTRKVNLLRKTFAFIVIYQGYRESARWDFKCTH